MIPDSKPFTVIDGISVDFSSTVLHVNTMLSYDWKATDEIESYFPNLQIFLFGFLSQEDMDIFVQHVVPTKLPHLSRSSKLRYAVIRDNKMGIRYWSYASPGSTVTIGV